VSTSFWRDWLLVVLVAGAVSIPFLNKAYHIDDPFILRITQNVIDDPLDPFQGEMDWLGWTLPIWDQASNPPLISYYLAPLAAVSNESEIVLHAAMMLFYLLLAAAVLFLARRFTNSSWSVVLFVMMSCGVVVSGNVMRDVPATALAAGSVALFVRGVDREQHGRVALGAYFAGLAILMKYSAVVLLPLLALYPLLQRRVRYLAWIGVPIAIFGLWCLHNALVYGDLHVLALLHRNLGTDRGWQDRLCGVPTITGSLLYLLPALVWAAYRARDRAVLFGLPFALGMVWALTQIYLDGAADGEFLFWSLSGTGLLYVLLTDGVWGAFRWLRDREDDESRDTLFLFAWLCAPLLFSVIFPRFQAVRHVLPALPPLVLLCFRYLRQRAPHEKGLWNGLLPFLLATQIGISFLVAAADFEYAGTYRKFARQIAQEPTEGTGQTWFVGHWGWLFYAQREGFRQLHSAGPLPAAGDRILWPLNGHLGPLLYQNKVLLDALHPILNVWIDSKWPVRTMTNGASFYAIISRPDKPGGISRLPYRFVHGPPLEIFFIHRFAPSS